jgi:hypothetical protein
MNELLHARRMKNLIATIAGNDTILGKAFLVRDPPRGEHILTFSMSRSYNVDFIRNELRLVRKDRNALQLAYGFALLSSGQ